MYIFFIAEALDLENVRQLGKQAKLGPVRGLSAPQVRPGAVAKNDGARKKELHRF